MYCISGLVSYLSVYQSLSNKLYDTLCNAYTFLLRIQYNLVENPPDFWKFINNKRTVSGYFSQLTYLNASSHNATLISEIFADFPDSVFDSSPTCSLHDCNLQ